MLISKTTFSDDDLPPEDEPTPLRTTDAAFNDDETIQFLFGCVNRHADLYTRDVYRGMDYPTSLGIQVLGELTATEGLGPTILAQLNKLARESANAKQLQSENEAVERWKSDRLKEEKLRKLRKLWDSVRDKEGRSN